MRGRPKNVDLDKYENDEAIESSIDTRITEAWFQVPTSNRKRGQN